MDTVKIREEISKYLEQADDRFLKLVYGLISADREENLEIPEIHKSIIRERLEDYKKNPGNTLTWEEVKSKTESKL
jgi:hypothetical protein